MSVTLISAPDAKPTTSADPILRAHLRLEADETEQDELIDSFIGLATRRIENFTRQRLITQTMRLNLNGFGRCGIEIPIWPVQSIAQVTYVDSAWDTQTLDASDYRLIDSEMPNELHPAYGSSWPVTRDDLGSVKIDVIAGYGDAGADLPDELMGALRLLVAHYFLHREAFFAGGSVEEIPHGVTDMLRELVFWV